MRPAGGRGKFAAALARGPRAEFGTRITTRREPGSQRLTHGGTGARSHICGDSSGWGLEREHERPAGVGTSLDASAHTSCHQVQDGQWLEGGNRATSLRPSYRRKTGVSSIRRRRAHLQQAQRQPSLHSLGPVAVSLPLKWEGSSSCHLLRGDFSQQRSEARRPPPCCAAHAACQRLAEGGRGLMAMAAGSLTFCEKEH